MTKIIGEVRGQLEEMFADQVGAPDPFTLAGPIVPTPLIELLGAGQSGEFDERPRR